MQAVYITAIMSTLEIMSRSAQFLQFISEMSQGLFAFFPL